MKKIIIAAVLFIACQSIALWMLSGVNFSSTTDEVDMEIYEFEHEGHGFLIFEEEGRGYIKPAEEIVTIAEAIEDLTNIKDLG